MKDAEGKPLPPPTKGDLVECSIAEEGGNRWFSGVVLSVNVTKKTIKVRLRPGENWEAQDERYKFSVSSHPLSTHALHCHPHWCAC